MHACRDQGKERLTPVFTSDLAYSQNANLAMNTSLSKRYQTGFQPRHMYRNLQKPAKTPCLVRRETCPTSSETHFQFPTTYQNPSNPDSSSSILVYPQ